MADYDPRREAENPRISRGRNYFLGKRKKCFPKEKDVGISLWNVSFVSQRSGDFASYTNFGDNSTMAAPWIFNNGTPGVPLPGDPLAALWQVGGFTFDLTISSVVMQNSTFLNVTGIGMVSGNGFDPTPGGFSFTSSGDGSSQPNFSFQANTAVPEPGTVGLLAIGAVGLAAAYHRRRNRRAAEEPLP